MVPAAVNRETKVKVPISAFPCQGIAEFTLFNEDLVPLAERLVYVNPEMKLHIEAQMSKERYETREKASLKISVKDDNGQPVVANLGVSVFDKLYKNPQNTKNILTNCLLTSEINGRLYDPAYYFDSRNKDRGEALDLLLLTQGWRNYVWSEKTLKVNSQKKPIISDGIEAEVFSDQSNIKTGDQQLVMAFNPERNLNNLLAILVNAGRFMIEPQHFKLGSGGYVYLKPMGPQHDKLQIKDKLRIRISDPFLSIDDLRQKKELNFPKERSAMIKNKDELTDSPVAGHNVIKLPQVIIKSQGDQTFRDKFIGLLDSLAKLNSSIERVYDGKYLNPDRSTDFKEKRTFEITTKINGVIYHGVKGPTGMVTVNYSDPNLSEEELMKMNNLTRVKGYYPHKDFYCPNYDKVSDENLIADFRNTLLWAPNVATNSKGEATLEFFCSDINFNFVGKIEGMSDEGLLGAQEFGFTVGKASNTK